MGNKLYCIFVKGASYRFSIIYCETNNIIEKSYIRRHISNYLKWANGTTVGRIQDILHQSEDRSSCPH